MTVAPVPRLGFADIVRQGRELDQANKDEIAAKQRAIAA